jgi:hypothetical protein
VDWKCECPQEERSTSITKQLVFQYPFCRKTSCNRVLERFLTIVPGRRPISDGPITNHDGSWAATNLRLHDGLASSQFHGHNLFPGRVDSRWGAAADNLLGVEG